MSATMQYHAREDGVDVIEPYFDMEQASLPCESESVDHSSNTGSGNDNITDADTVEFVPITGQKEDPYTKQLNEALKHENRSGGRGPFVFSYSPAVFMGRPDRVEEERVERAASIPQQQQQQQQQPSQMPQMPQIPPEPLAYTYTHGHPRLVDGFQPHHYVNRERIWY
ncbi:hypothetical protein F5B18DRAFT_646246 [Nemania serpens]|nr:hypothetical protein F5B18DRAFT_646246 [Nemania serpens]